MKRDSKRIALMNNLSRDFRTMAMDFLSARNFDFYDEPSNAVLFDKLHKFGLVVGERGPGKEGHLRSYVDALLAAGEKPSLNRRGYQRKRRSP